MITNIIAAAIILLAVGASLRHIIKEKKRGVKCIGCPDSGCCAPAVSNRAGESDSGCGCGCGGKK